MKPLLPGQAAFTRHKGVMSLVACDEPQNLPLGNVGFLVRGGLYQIAVAGVTVPVVNVILRLTANGAERFYIGWVDELDPDGSGTLESLTTQLELPIILADPLGASFARAVTENGLRTMAIENLAVISPLASRNPWLPPHFAAALTYLESQHPTPADLWAKLGGP